MRERTVLEKMDTEHDCPDEGHAEKEDAATVPPPLTHLSTTTTALEEEEGGHDTHPRAYTLEDTDLNEKYVSSSSVLSDDSREQREAEGKQITRIIDIRLMPLFCVFYFMDHLDRANIGNVSLAGIQTDLNLTAKQLSAAISAFYITYIIFEVPSNIILKRTSAVMWLSVIMLIWGVMTLAMAFVRDFQSLFACRLLLGAAESGYIPGILYLMSKFYRPREFGLRIALFLCMSSVSGLVSGPIAYGTAYLEGQKGLHGWQYLFILEGVPTIVLSVVSYFFLFDDVSQVSWLTAHQKAVHKALTHATEVEAPITVHSFLRAVSDWKCGLFSSVYFLSAVNTVSFQVFTPTIIDGFGFSVLTSQLLSAPPHFMQLVAVITGGYIADRYANKRGVLIMAGFGTGALGYLLLIVLKDIWARYVALFIISGGMGLQMAANVGWAPINFPELEIRAIAVAFVVMMGSTGGIVASYLYPGTDKPQFCKSMHAQWR
ncbi:major facilitator superfamily domain-containing protein [Mycotypha africana]|uniref:major facilitator superfamily domain-containing protein n=1 Tax=Mycotypha africana TaxID=64632 RepID=UPI0023017B29|nr:major facilitator superfamily domain-containing protein [Mycotypha africana]KAI8977614.1 major facilitator superfamily domain-containing protein [Mycotypha africana]